MPLQLLVRLGLKTQDPAEVLIVSDEQAELQVTSELNLHQIPSRQSAIILLDARLVRITEVKLPQASKQQLLKAVPFALEESIAQSLESTHFALGNAHADVSPVAIIEKTRFTEITHTLESAHLQNAPIYSEIQALPLFADSWTLLAEAESVLVRTGPYRGFRCGYAEFLSLFQLSIQQTVELPHRIKLLLSPEHHLNKDAIQALMPQAIIEQSAIQNSFTTFRDALSQPVAPLLDLRQGEFQPTHLLKMTQWWRLAIIALIANTLIAGSLYAGEYYVLHKKNQQLDQQINQQYHRIFPQASSVVAPDTRIQQQLQTVQSQAIGSPWHQLMSASIAAISRFDSIECTEIHFNDGKLTLQIKADDVASLTQFVKDLERKNIRVTQEKSIGTDKTISAKLILQGVPT